jgi:hypothetical protein
MRINRLQSDLVEMYDENRVIYVNYYFNFNRNELTIYSAKEQDLWNDEEWNEEERPYQMTDSEEKELLEWLEDDFYMNEGLIDLLG